MDLGRGILSGGVSARSMDMRGTGGSLPPPGRAVAPPGGSFSGSATADRPYKSWSDEPRAKQMRKDVEIIEVDKKGDWTRKEEAERRRRAKQREQEEAEMRRNEEATLRKLQELERKEREIMEKERRLQEEIRRKEEQRRFEEQRREEERRLIEIRQREEELLRKEEKLKRMEMERRRTEELLRLEDERAHMDRLRREEMERARDFQQQGQYRQMMEAQAVHQSWVSAEAARGGGYGAQQRGYGPPLMNFGGPLLDTPMQNQMPYGGHVGNRSTGGRAVVSDRRTIRSTSHRGGGGRPEVSAAPSKKAEHAAGRGSGATSGKITKRSSAFNRLGPKMPVKARLGGNKPDAADRQSSGTGEKGMSITIGGGARQVAKKVGVVDASHKPIRETEAERKEREKIKERERKLRERLLKEEEERKKKEVSDPTIQSLDTVVIKRREKTGAAKATNGKTMTIKTPNNLVAKLAAKLKEMPKPGVIPAEKSDKEKTALKKKIKDKYKKESLPERILYMALENVAYDESRAILLITKMLKDDTNTPKKVPEVVTVDDNDEDKLDFEADEPDN